MEPVNRLTTWPGSNAQEDEDAQDGSSEERVNPTCTDGATAIGEF
jgi:hypothetical protein